MTPMEREVKHLRTIEEIARHWLAKDLGLSMPKARRLAARHLAVNAIRAQPFFGQTRI
jgi:hypothetical protein